MTKIFIKEDVIKSNNLTGEWELYARMNIGVDVLIGSSKSYNALKGIIGHFDAEAIESASNNNNYGLLFFACGYDGRKQTELMEEYSSIGVYVF